MVEVPWRRRDPYVGEMAVRLFESVSGGRGDQPRATENHARLRGVRVSGFRCGRIPALLHALRHARSVHDGILAGGLFQGRRDVGCAARTWRRERVGAGRRGAAQVVEIQARTEFGRFDPMEVVASVEEMARLLAANRDKPFVAFPEDRRFPVRMTEFLPARWMKTGPSDRFEGQAQPNEYYAFQVAVYAMEDVELAKCASEFRNERGAVIPAEAVTCLNLEGYDWIGRHFTKTIPVPAGKVQVLWLGVDVPRDAAGTYRGSVTIVTTAGQELTVQVALSVSGPVLEDRGDGELWRHSRIRWLNSRIGIDDEPTVLYPPLEVDGSTVTCLGRRILIGPDGLPRQIQSLFEPTGDRVGETPTNILHRPIEFVASVAGAALKWQDNGLTIEKLAAGRVQVCARRVSGPLSVDCRADIEFDGHVDYYLTLKATQDVDLSDTRLKIRYRRDIARYFLGFGSKGGYRPKEWKYRWSVDFSNNMVWMGRRTRGCNASSSTWRTSGRP